MEIDKSQSKSLSKASSRSSKKKVSDLASDDISMSQLEMLANKKKLNKKSDEITIENDEIIKEQSKEISIDKKKSESTVKSKTRRTITSTVSSTDSEEQKKYDRKKVNKENKNETVRKEKSEILFKLYTIVEKSNGRWSTKLTMDNSLDEIKNEFTRIKAVLDNEAMVKFCKHGLVMGIKGVEMLNNAYDPIGVDLDGWSEAMSYNMATTEYDEVLSELCEKYKGAGSMSPEVKLLVMIVMSGAMFSFSKKAAKDPNTLSNLMGAFMKKSPAPQPQPEPRPSFQAPPPSQQPIFNLSQPRQQPQPQGVPNDGQQFFSTFVQQPQSQIPSLASLNRNRQMDIDTEDSDDIPSKIRGPDFDSPDSVNIENIIKTMKAKQNQKEQELKIRPDIEQILNETDSSEDIVRNIPAPKPRGKGRPRKNAPKASARN